MLLIAIVLCLIVIVWALFFRGESDAPITPDYPPQGTDDKQKPIENDDTDKIDSPEGGGAIRVTFSPEASVSLSDKKVKLYYANPGASNQNVALLIMIGDTVVAKSEMINPGFEINELKLEDYAVKKLQAGTYNATLVVRSYDPESGEKAMVDTQGELSLTVTE